MIIATRLGPLRNCIPRFSKFPSILLRNTVLVCAFLITQTLSVSVEAQSKPNFGKRGDVNWGFADFRTPRFSGERELSVLVQNSRLDQTTPARNNPRAGKLRIELQYKRPKETWKQNPADAHTVIPTQVSQPKLSSGNSVVSRLLAVLPQVNRSAYLPQLRDTNRFPYLARYPYLARDYYRHPIKFFPGETVEYRWVMVDEKGRIVNRGGKLGTKIWSVGKFKMPKPFSIAIMGDSFSSGEGAPLEPKQREQLPFSFIPDIAHLGLQPMPPENQWGHFAKWGNASTVNNNQQSLLERRSHRSSNSGLLQGVKKFKNERPKIWLEYKHTGISSATISAPNSNEKHPKKGGMYTNFQGGRELFISGLVAGSIYERAAPWQDFGIIDSSDNTLEPQLSVVEQWLTNSRIGCLDTVLMSAGGNDGGFARVIQAAVTNKLSRDLVTVNDEIVVRGLRNATPHVDTLFEELNYYAKPISVLWSEYPDPTKNGRGEFKSMATHPQTLAMGIEIAATLAEQTGLYGALVGAFTRGGFQIEDLLRLGPGPIRRLRNANLNIPIFVMTTQIGTGDFNQSHLFLRDKINRQVGDWCASKSNCTVIPVQNRSARNGLSAGTRHPSESGSVHPSQRRWFNTFIDSYRYTCGGIDCVVHPTKTGFREIYRDPAFEKILASYDQVLAFEKNNPRSCRIKPANELADRKTFRNNKGRQISENLPPVPDPDRKNYPPTDDEMKGIIELLRLTGTGEDIKQFQSVMQTGKLPKLQTR